MTLRRILVPLLCAGLGVAADTTAAAPTAKAPWSESFTMTLKDSERTFVVYDGTSYLVIDKADLEDREFVSGKDVMLAAKFERADGMLGHFYNLSRLDAVAGSEVWATRLDGDNLYVFGRVVVDAAGKAMLTAEHVAEAPSDSQIIADHLAKVADEDYDGRLQVAEWARDMAAKQGNRELWNAAADTIVSQVVENAAKRAADAKDTKLLLRAVDWSLALIHDRSLAARICSTEWVRTAGEDVGQQIAERMKRLDYVFYHDQWRPKAEALAMEFDDRFGELKWRDADGYYKLGRWAEANVEVLPHARELAHRCFQAGFRGDPRHNGIRRELGMEPVSGATARAETLAGPYIDPDTGVSIEGPENWTRTTPIDGDATWIDPQSDTAYITARVLMGNELAAGFDDTWTAQTAPWVGKTGYQKLDEQPLTFPGTARRLTFSYREARYARQADVIYAYNEKAKIGVVLHASYTEGEKDETVKALMQVFAKLVIPEAPAPVQGVQQPNGALPPSGALPPNGGPGNAAPSPGNTVPSPGNTVPTPATRRPKPAAK